MGRFDLDNLLNELGLHRRSDGGGAEHPADGDSADSPTAPSSATALGLEAEHAMGDAGQPADETHPNHSVSAADDAAPVDPVPHENIDHDGTAAAPGAANDSETLMVGDETDREPDRPFVRNDPREVPRPPDTSGRGLEKNIDMERVTARAAAMSLRPDDALGFLWGSSDDLNDLFEGVDDLGEVLRQRGIIAPDQLSSLRTVLRQSPGKQPRDVLLEMGVQEEAIQQVVAEINQLPFERIDVNDGFNVGFLNKLGVDFCKSHQVLPLRKDNSRIVVGTVRPDDVFILDEVRRLLGGSPIRHVLVTSGDIQLILDMQTQGAGEEIAVDDILADIDEGDVEVVENNVEDVDFAKQAGESPVIRYVNFIIQTALKEGASDIHIEPAEKKLKVRFRIDGILFEMMNPPYRMHAAIISRLKIMANLDISERRLPQDGRIRAVVNGRKLDLRVSTLPTVTGEKCVLRILDARSISVGLDQLGFDESTLTIWKRQIEQPHGIILVTGPTGSGKTTTLYSSLREMDTKKLNISTTEDPVEYHLDGITQVQIHERIGMTFAAALRSLLRQDPDVVMVGEIRDSETARIAVQAALTGHLVLSTLHTNDAPSSVTRLINIGVEPFLIGAALNGVLAQRLVRRICSHCRAEEKPSEELAEFLTTQGLEAQKIYHGSGCDRCRQTGYAGRVGIYEMLVLDDVTRDAIARSPNVTEFRRMCVERGMVTLRQDGLHKVVQGMTTIEEIMRVTEATI